MTSLAGFSLGRLGPDRFGGIRFGLRGRPRFNGFGRGNGASRRLLEHPVRGLIGVMRLSCRGRLGRGASNLRPPALARHSKVEQVAKVPYRSVSAEFVSIPSASVADWSFLTFVG